MSPTAMVTPAQASAPAPATDDAQSSMLMQWLPLSAWLEFAETTSKGDDKNNNSQGGKKELIIRKTTVAYGIVEVLKRSKKLENEEIRIDNFAVSVLKNPTRSWDDIKGVGMISSGLTLIMEEPPYLSDLLADDNSDDQKIVGRCLEVEQISAPPKENTAVPPAAGNGFFAGMDVLAAVAEESNHCHLFARLLYELFACDPFPDDALKADQEPPPKRAKPDKVLSHNLFSHKLPSRKNFMTTLAERRFRIPCIVRMQDIGIPASICLMTQNLLEYALRGDGRQSDNAHDSLGVVGEDLHLLLLDPHRFLFDNENQTTENTQLLYRTGKLYGRAKEKTLITDAFCRVSRGKSEAFFIGGFSGSGKTMLVNSLTATINAVGGYMIKHKFDPMPREEPIAGVISAFNQICLMIKGSARPTMAKKIWDEFGVEINMLMRLLPNVNVLFPDFVSSPTTKEAGAAMNARSVCFTLLRFVRLISSPRHPVMLFLDDMQWADGTALDVVHTILSDTRGSCMFFVGTYRDNEVRADHDIFNLVERLEISNVRTTKVHLAGLNQDDLNTMISDALCLYPRICKSLTGIVFQKTNGNPFFMMEFVSSLKSRGLLRYNFHQKRWVWNEGMIHGETITDNVVHLLYSKMSCLPRNVQTLLAVMACFGSSTNESVVARLSESQHYSGVRNGMVEALSDGFIRRDEEGYLHFAHDKVREASYNLIHYSVKRQFHYNLGKELYSLFCGKGNDAGNTILLIAGQINHGREWIISDKDFRIAVAELNMKAGKKAIDGCDHKTAYSYLRFAMSLLPNDHWESHYDLSLSLSFLFSSAANSSCRYDEAEQMIRRTLQMARCLEDQLPSYLLLSQILQAQGKVNDVYDTCSTILTELGESIPESNTFAMASRQIVETINTYEQVGDKWLKGEKTADKTLHKTLQFYNVIALAAYFCKSHGMIVHFACKAVHLTLQRGLSEHTAQALIQFTSVVTKEDNAVSCYRIAKDAMSLQERFDVAAVIPDLYFNFYGRIAWRFEPLQAGIYKLRQGFEAGLSSGNADMGLHCAIQVIKNTIYIGANLSSILKEIGYYLQILEKYQSEMGRTFLLIFRETVSTLIDNGKATGIKAVPSVGDLNDQENKFRESVLYHSAIRCYWLGHTERCRYYSEKCMKGIENFRQGGNITAYVAQFFIGLNALDLLRKNKHVDRSSQVARLAIAALKCAAVNSDSNFTNKLRLLEAEQQSLGQSHSKAIGMYDASITCAKRSGLIHEQGLACEKAGFYFKRVGKDRQALEYFQQARDCYQEWGSSMKVAVVQKELDGLNPPNGITATAAL